MVDSKSEIGLQPSTSTAPSLALPYYEPISTPVSQKIHLQQQIPTVFTEPQTKATPEVRQNHATATYQAQYHGPNLISLEQQVKILQNLTQIPQSIHQITGYMPSSTMYPNYITFPFTASVPQQGTTSPLPTYYPGLLPQTPNVAANPQPLGWQWNNQGMIPIWHNITQAQPAANAAKKSLRGSQRNYVSNERKGKIRMHYPIIPVECGQILDTT